jgi:hypothetical protein
MIQSINQSIVVVAARLLSALSFLLFFRVAFPSTVFHPSFSAGAVVGASGRVVSWEAEQISRSWWDHTATATPPHAFATTSTETIDFSIGFGFAALIHVSLWISRQFYIDFVDVRREIRVFTRFGSPHHAKCHQKLANSALHGPNSLGTRSKPLWIFLKMDLTLLLMEEMENLMKVIDSAPETRSSARPLQPQKLHHHPPDTPPTMENHQFANGAQSSWMKESALMSLGQKSTAVLKTSFSTAQPMRQ